MGAGPASDIVALLLVFVLDPLVMGEATANISVIEVVFFVHVTCCREVSGNVRHVYSLVLSASPVGIGGCLYITPNTALLALRNTTGTVVGTASAGRSRSRSHPATRPTTPSRVPATVR